MMSAYGMQKNKATSNAGKRIGRDGGAGDPETKRQKAPEDRNGEKDLAKMSKKDGEKLTKFPSDLFFGVADEEKMRKMLEDCAEQSEWSDEGDDQESETGDNKSDDEEVEKDENQDNELPEDPEESDESEDSFSGLEDRGPSKDVVTEAAEKASPKLTGTGADKKKQKTMETVPDDAKISETTADSQKLLVEKISATKSKGPEKSRTQQSFSPLREETTTTAMEPQTPRKLPEEFTLRRTRGSPRDDGQNLVLKFLKAYGVRATFSDVEILDGPNVMPLKTDNTVYVSFALPMVLTHHVQEIVRQTPEFVEFRELSKIPHILSFRMDKKALLCSELCVLAARFIAKTLTDPHSMMVGSRSIHYRTADIDRVVLPLAKIVEDTNINKMAMEELNADNRRLLALFRRHNDFNINV